jgi:Flp pilus assembly protein TadG
MTAEPSRHRTAPGESGQILIMTALMLPVLLGFMALALDAGYAFDYRKRVHSAADSGALAGAHAVDYEPSIPMDRLRDIVLADVARHGFTNGVGGVVVQVFRSPSTTDGFEFSYTSDTTAVGVIVRQPKNLFFIQVLSSSFASLTIGAASVASKGNTSDLNIVVLHPTDYDALTAQGNGNIQVSGSVYVNSCAGNGGCASTGSGSYAAEAVGGSSVVQSSVGVFVTGTAGGAVSPVTVGTPPLADPLASLAAPSVPGTIGVCAAGVCTPGLYTGGIDLGAGVWTLLPGLYYINGGGLSFHHGAIVTGNGVTIYNSGIVGTYGQFEIDQSATTVSLTAPSSGTYRAIVYFQDRNNTRTFSVKQGTIAMNGLIYMKNAGIEFLAGGTTPPVVLHAIFIVSTMRLLGGGLIADNDFSSFGGAILQKVSLAE